MDLNFKEFGDGDPVIILHGLFGTSDNWQTLAKQLAEDYTVFIVDQRNHGRSPHDSEFNYQLMAEDLEYFMRDKWIDEARIVGHSMGGKTAMQFALNYPKKVTQLAVVDIGVQQYTGGHEAIIDALLGLDLKNVESRKDADAKIGATIKEYGVRQFLLKNLTRTKDGQYKWKMNLPVIHRNYQKILDAISSENTYDGPTHFIKGENSKYLDLDKVDDIRKLFPKATFEEVKMAGHWVHAEAPEDTLRILRTFFDE